MRKGVGGGREGGRCSMEAGEAARNKEMDGMTFEQ